MKHTLNAINKAGVVNAGLEKTTIVLDWHVLDYISKQPLVQDDMALINYENLINELPLLGLVCNNTKSPLLIIVKRLIAVGLITCTAIDDSCFYAKTTDLYNEIRNFKHKIGV